MGAGGRKARGGASAPEESARKSDPFIDLVEEALKEVADPQRLGESSPLAMPYVLGRHLETHPQATTSLGRGQVLQQLLLEAACALADAPDKAPTPGGQRQRNAEAWGTQAHSFYLGRLREHLEHGSVLQRLLFWRYFRSTSAPSVEAVIANANLGVERAHYHRLRKEAIGGVTTAMLQILQPSLRLELLPTPVGLVGRAEVEQAVVTVLRQGKAVALTGPAGFGKTALAAAVAQHIGPQTTFWFTVRPGINDNLSALLYELAAFLARHSTGSLWRQLIAAKGSLREPMLAALRFDLTDCQVPVLLCFDEADLLTPGAAHEPVLTLLAELRGRVPLLLLGQHLALEVDVEHGLTGLSLSEMGDLLARAGIHLAPETQADLHRHTEGSPRLLELFISLHQDGEPLEVALERIGSSVSLRSLYTRIERRLGAEERQLLRMLAVYRDSAPEDIWETATLEKLLTRRLAQQNGPGRVSLVPALRPLAYAQIRPLERRRLHQIAGLVRAERGEYTAATYHYLKAGQPTVALWTWHPHREQEIEQGHAGTALLLLQQIARSPRDADDQRVLALDISQLELLVGELDQAQATLNQTPWPEGHVLSARARRILGTIADLQSLPAQARAAYQEGLRTVEQIAHEHAIFHKNLSWVALRERDLDTAWREACLARYEAVNMQGYVQEERGEYARAHTCYLEALAIAQQSGYWTGEAKTSNNLSRLAGKQGRFDESVTYARQAARLYRQIGDLSMTASVQVNLALASNQAGRPGDAIAPATEALAFFQQSDQAWGKAAAAQNLAEAYLACGQLQQAVVYAQIVIETNERQTLPDGLRVLGETRLAMGETAAALRLIISSIRAAVQNNDPFLGGYAWRALGRVLLVCKKPQLARGALDRAITLFEQLDLPAEITITQAIWPQAEVKERTTLA